MTSTKLPNLESTKSVHFHKKTMSNGKLEDVIQIKKKKILVCDDSSTLRKSVRNLISNNKEISIIYDVLECYDGADMLIKIVEDQENNNLIEIIITDENMESMCGSTAIGIIREWENLKKVKRIYIPNPQSYNK